MPAIVMPTSVSSSCAGTTTATRLPSSTALCASARRERLPRERRDEPEQEAEERRDDDVVAPASRRRLHGGRMREDARQLDLLHLLERELGAVLILEELPEQDRGARVRAAASSDPVDLLLIRRDTRLQQLDLRRAVAGHLVDYLARERVGGDSRLPGRRGLDGDAYERVLLDARRAHARGAACHGLRRD